MTMIRGFIGLNYFHPSRKPFLFSQSQSKANQVARKTKDRNNFSILYRHYIFVNAIKFHSLFSDAYVVEFDNNAGLVRGRNLMSVYRTVNGTFLHGSTISSLVYENNDLSYSNFNKKIIRHMLFLVYYKKSSPIYIAMELNNILENAKTILGPSKIFVLRQDMPKICFVRFTGDESKKIENRIDGDSFKRIFSIAVYDAIQNLYNFFFVRKTLRNNDLESFYSMIFGTTILPELIQYYELIEKDKERIHDEIYSMKMRIDEISSFYQENVDKKIEEYLSVFYGKIIDYLMSRYRFSTIEGVFDATVQSMCIIGVSNVNLTEIEISISTRNIYGLRLSVMCVLEDRELRKVLVRLKSGSDIVEVMTLDF